MRKIAFLAVAATAVFGVASSAQAAKGTYAGSIPGTTGKIALDVKVKQGYVVKITHLRGAHIPSNCEISGPIPEVSFDLPASLTVNQQTAKFKGTYEQPTYGNESTIKGTIYGNKMEGKIHVNYHYAAEGSYPEETCDTGKLAFKAKYGATDGTVGTPPARPNWR